jgi:phosphoglycolate phosphatase
LATSTLTACDSVMIGDRRHDVIGALRNGVVAAGVLWGYGSEHELRVAGAQALLSVPSDVERLL